MSSGTATVSSAGLCRVTGTCSWHSWRFAGAGGDALSANTRWPVLTWRCSRGPVSFYSGSGKQLTQEGSPWSFLPSNRQEGAGQSRDVGHCSLWLKA